MKKAHILAAALAIVPGSAMAAPGDLSVKYSDLDLSSDKATEQFERRAERAARKHCAAENATPGSRLVRTANIECARQFKEAAMRQFAAILDGERKGG